MNSAIQIQNKLKLVSCITFSLFFLSYLSIEYYFDECTALYVSADEVALFESVVVAVSIVGFLLYALFSKYPFFFTRIALRGNMCGCLTRWSNIQCRFWTIFDRCTLIWSSYLSLFGCSRGRGSLFTCPFVWSGF